MEGIPPEDIKEHEKQKTGIKTFCYTFSSVLRIMMYVQIYIFLNFAWDTVAIDVYWCIDLLSVPVNKGMSIDYYI